jgi:gliding motility-associated protein GldL
MKPGSKRWKQFMAKLYGIGASVVIIGALFKIEHWPGSSLLLIIGLSTEAVIFFFSAFEPPHEEPDWSLVYPELASGQKNEDGSDSRPLTEQLDDMLGEAKIGPDLIESLGEGMRSLSSNANKLSDISDASVATSEYSDSLRGASEKVGELTDTYVKASESLTGLTSHAEDGERAGENLQKMNENLSSLNGMYELQLQELEKTRDMYAGMQELITNLNDSIDDTRLYKDNIAELASNLQSLNTVYSNMLNAMGAGVRQEA